MNRLHRHILVVDDEFLIVEGLCAQIGVMGMKVCATADTAVDAVNLAKQHMPSVVLMDMRLKGLGDGVDAALAIHKTVGSRVIFITGSTEPSTLARIQLDHPAAVLIKPITFRQLKGAIETAMSASP